MYMRIGCVDERTYTSDSMTDEELQAELDANDGFIGTGARSNFRVATIDEAIEAMNNTIEQAVTNGGVVTMEINGRRRPFNASNIVWWEFSR